jgi:hypothetical protein
VVKPIHKKGDTKILANYRPIALVSVFSKLFEKAMVRHIEEFLTKFSVIKNEQYGFQNSKSTTMAAYDLIQGSEPV